MAAHGQTTALVVAVALLAACQQGSDEAVRPATSTTAAATTTAAASSAATAPAERSGAFPAQPAGVPWPTDESMPGYSIAKSITSALIGTLVRDGRLEIDEPAPVPEWHEDPDDPRAAITVGSDTEDVRAYLDRELFDRIGMDSIRTEFDSAGTWLGGFSADTTARDFARFGLLYLRGGEWDGQQILPEEWVEFSRTPSPANPGYGAHWWLDPERPGVSYAVGVRGQVITVDPAHDLVILQLSTSSASPTTSGTSTSTRRPPPSRPTPAWWSGSRSGPPTRATTPTARSCPGRRRWRATSR